MTLLAATTGNNGGLILAAVIAVVIGVGAFKLWLIVARPDVYRAQLENERARREQRNRLIGPSLGVGFKLLGLWLGRKR